MMGRRLAFRRITIQTRLEIGAADESPRGLTTALRFSFGRAVILIPKPCLPTAELLEPWRVVFAGEGFRSQRGLKSPTVKKGGEEWIKLIAVAGFALAVASIERPGHFFAISKPSPIDFSAMISTESSCNFHSLLVRV